MNIGDVFTAKSLATEACYGYEHNDERGLVLNKGTVTVGHRFISAYHTFKNQQDPSFTKTELVSLDCLVTDDQLADVEWVVADHQHERGGTDTARNDPVPYPDRDWFVARRLKPDGSFDPAGQVLNFHSPQLKDPVVVRQMQRTFV